MFEVWRKIVHIHLKTTCIMLRMSNMKITLGFYVECVNVNGVLAEFEPVTSRS